MLHAIGVDIGGTKTSVGLLTEHGQIVAQRRLPTDPQAGFDQAVARYAAAIGELLQDAGLPAGQLAGIGIGCPGPLNPFSGVIHNDFTLPGWRGKNIVAALASIFRLPVRLENDADAALVGEARAGAGKDARNLVMLTFGTGVGGAVLAGGHIYRGANGEHPEIGHVPVDPGGPACYCGLSGCLEALASGSAVAHAGRRAGFGDSQAVFAAARQGQAPARRIVARSVHAAQVALWTIIHCFLPDRVILGGGIMQDHYDLFEPALREVTRRLTMGPSTGMQICQARLGNDAGLVGAGFLGLGAG